VRDPAHTLTTRRLSALRRVAGAGNFSARKPMPGIIIDPLRAWGNPTAGRSRIQWFALAGPVNAGDTMRGVADWFEVPLRRVVAAWRYDRLRNCRPHYRMMELAGKLQMARYWEAQGREEGGL